MSNWDDNPDRYRGFPKHIRDQAVRELDYRCARCGDDTSALELDHIRNRRSGGRHTLANAQWLCTPCHTEKTAAEARAAAAARATRGRHPREAHPGLLPSNVAGTRTPR